MVCPPSHAPQQVLYWRHRQACCCSATGPALAAYAELVPEAGTPAAGELRSWCTERLAPAAVPSAVLLLPQLPRSAGGKVQRSALPLPPAWQQQAEQAGEKPRQGASEELPAAGATEERPPKRVRAEGSEGAASRQQRGGWSEPQVARAFAAALEVRFASCVVWHTH